MSVELPAAGIFSNVFSDLPSSEKPGEIKTRPTLFTIRDRDIFAARDFSGRPHLLVPVLGGSPIEEQNGITQAISASFVKFPNSNGTEEVFLDIVCSESGADEVFGAICNEYCQSFVEDREYSPQELIASIESVIQKWQSVLKALKLEQPPISVQMGLFGELLFLSQCVDKLGPSAIDAWFGPDNSRHDFEFSTGSFEVKTSRVLAEKRMTVHGLAQFDVSSDSKLHLLLIQVEFAAKGTTIGDLVSSLLASGVSAAKLNLKLAKFHEEFAVNPPEWSTTLKYKPFRISLFQIQPDFPTLKAQDFDAKKLSRISKIEYSMKLDGLPCREFSSSELARLQECLP
jgi:hypothetical protein